MPAAQRPLPLRGDLANCSAKLRAPIEFHRGGTLLERCIAPSERADTPTEPAATPYHHLRRRRPDHRSIGRNPGPGLREVPVFPRSKLGLIYGKVVGSTGIDEMRALTCRSTNWLGILRCSGARKCQCLGLLPPIFKISRTCLGESICRANLATHKPLRASSSDR